MEQKTILLEQADLLVSRLERLSADSIWAHRVSGYRGALLRSIEQLQNQSTNAVQMQAGEAQELKYLANLLENGYDLLEKAAREILA